MKRPIQIVLMPLFCLWSEAAIFSSAGAQTLDSVDVAILKITYEGLMPKPLGEIDSGKVDSMMHAQFRKEAEMRRMILMNEQWTASALGEAHKTLQDDSTYFEALAKLNLQYAFVIDFEQLGRFVQILFRRYHIGEKEPLVYPVGTTLDSLAHDIQKAVRDSLFADKSSPQKKNTLAIDCLRRWWKCSIDCRDLIVSQAAKYNRCLARAAKA
ncbi:MAG: hypothetical protein ACREOI_00875 [bacterium]